MAKTKYSSQTEVESNPSSVRLPYIDYLLTGFKEDNKHLQQSFGRHLHWGYWENPKTAQLSADDFTQAAEELSRQICLAGHIQDKQSVLDVGCGFGGTIAHINDNYNNMALVGVNLDERQLLRARETVKPANNNLIDFKQGNACALPLPDASFDVVLAVECIFHFPDRELFFKEAFRVLKPGGYLALSDFISNPFIKPIATIRLKLPEKFSVGFYGKCNLQYGFNDYRKLAEKTHFSIQTERDITPNTLPTYRYLRQLARHSPISNVFAVTETLAAEVLSKTGLLLYYIYGLQKPLN